jgi:uncharacterized membrane protein
MFQRMVWCVNYKKHIIIVPQFYGILGELFTHKQTAYLWIVSINVLTCDNFSFSQGMTAQGTFKKWQQGGGGWGKSPEQNYVRWFLLAVPTKARILCLDSL